MRSLNLEYIFLKIYNLFTSPHSLEGKFVGLKNTIVFILSIVAVFFLALIIYSFMRLKEREKENHHRIHHAIINAGQKKEEKGTNKKWQMVLDLITSANPSDWRLAIMEADTLLDTVTKDIGLIGADLGERLKNASPDHFKTLDNAWEAHKIRNRVAHDGLAYQMPYKDAKRAIALYESVFSEFKVI
jgi:hypothetical protein